MHLSLRMTTGWSGVALLVAISSEAASVSAQDANVTADSVRTRLLQWEQSIAQFWIVWETEWDPNSKLAEEAGQAGVRSISRDEWGRTAGGAEYWHSIVINDGVLDSRRLWTRDGRGKAFTATYEAGESAIDRPKTLLVGPDTGGWTQVVRAPFMGLWSTRTDCWLGTALGEYPAHFEGTESWDGRELPVLIVTDAERSEMQLALDPDVGMLPRAARSVYRAGDGPRVGHTFETLEFRELQPGFFFPWRGRANNPSNSSNWSMIEVKLNGPLSTQMFSIEPVDGTYVENIITGVSGYHGKAPAQVLAPVPDQWPTNTDSPPAVAAAQETPWTLLLGIMGITLLGGAWLLQRQRGRVA